MEDFIQKYKDALTKINPAVQSLIKTVGNNTAEYINSQDIEGNLLGEHFKSYNEINSNRPNMLGLGNFAERVENYERIISYIKNQWVKATKLLIDNDFQTSIFLSFVVMEESAKMLFAWDDLLNEKTGNQVKEAEFFKSHQKKGNFLFVVHV
jgi:hypothetical protein